MAKNDIDLIWENYITANWGYENYANPSSYKYANIPSPTKDSYYQQGKFPTGPGQGTQYVPSMDEENVKDDNIAVYAGTIGYNGAVGDYLYVAVPKAFYTTTRSTELDSIRRFKAMILRIVRDFINKNEGYTYSSSNKEKFKKHPLHIKYDLNKLNQNENIVLIDKLGNIIDKNKPKNNQPEQLELDLWKK